MQKYKNTLSLRNVALKSFSDDVLLFLCIVAALVLAAAVKGERLLLAYFMDKVKNFRIVLNGVVRWQMSARIICNFVEYAESG